MKGLYEIVFSVAATVAIGYVFAAPGIWDSPQVHVSHSTNECVRVINYNPDDKYACDNLPDLYSHVWVR
jgi:hypothetical protein